MESGIIGFGRERYSDRCRLRRNPVQSSTDLEHSGLTQRDDLRLKCLSPTMIKEA